MAKPKISQEDLPTGLPGDDEIRMLDEISENCIPNRSEIISIKSDKLGRTISISRDDVYKAASTLASNHQVSQLFGIDKNTLAKHFTRELEMARAFARQKMIARFYYLALNNAHPAYVIFAMKNWANMSDTGLTEDLGEMEEGVEFKVRRPTKPIETLTALETTADRIEANDE